MPLNEIQKHVLAVLRHKRWSESHVAGDVLINRDDPSPRFSSDIDFFHDRPEIVQRFLLAPWSNPLGGVR